MRKSISVISVFLLLAALQSCETVFDIAGSSTGKLFVQCCPGARDTTILQMYGTIPVGSKQKAANFLESADIDIMINGAGETLQFAEEHVGSVPDGCWFIPHMVNPGDVIELKASSGKYPEITATTTVPAALPEFGYDINAGSVSVSFVDDREGDDSVYGLGMVLEATIDGPDDYHQVELHNAIPQNDDSGIWGTSLNNDFLDVRFNGWAFGYFRTIVRLWPKAGDNGDEITLEMKFIDDIFVPADGEPYMVHLRYKVRLYRFSREFYNYAIALDNIENNMFASLGIAPASFAYSNVNGGLGVFAGWSMRETDWIEE